MGVAVSINPFSTKYFLIAWRASWHREELSIALSEDDTRTWAEPVAISRQKDGQIGYPFIFEPGELWITAGLTWIKEWVGTFFPFRVRIDEEEFFARMVKEK